MLWMQGQRCSASRPSFSSLQGEKVPGGCQGFPVRQGGRSHRGWQSPGGYPYEAGKGCAEAISSLPSAAKPGTEGSRGRQSPNAASGKAERHQGAPEHPPPSHLAHRQTQREGERRPEDSAARVLPGEGMPGAIRPTPQGGPGPARVWGRYLMAAMASTACRHITASVLRGASFCRSTWGGRARPRWGTGAASARPQSAAGTGTQSGGPVAGRAVATKACLALSLCPDARVLAALSAGPVLGQLCPSPSAPLGAPSPLFASASHMLTRNSAGTCPAARLRRACGWRPETSASRPLPDSEGEERQRGRVRGQKHGQQEQGLEGCRDGG